MKKAVIYARFRGEESKAFQSIETQLKQCNDYANEIGLSVVKAYIDVCVNCESDDRPSRKCMLKDSRHSDWDVILLANADRLTRNIDEYVKWRRRKRIMVVGSESTPEMEAWLDHFLDECKKYERRIGGRK